MLQSINATLAATAGLLVAGLLLGTRPATAQTVYPVNCTTTSFLFQNDLTDVYEVDLTSGKSYQRTTNGIPGAATKLNAFGYNQVDNYLWGQVYNANQVVRVGKDSGGNYAAQTFAVAGLPASPFVVGDVSPSGKMYLAVGGSYSTNQIYVIDLTQPTNALTATALTTTLTIITDWAVSPADNNLYAVSTNVGSNTSAPTLYRFLTANRTNADNSVTPAGTREVLGVLAGVTADKNGNSTSYNFGSAFMDVNGSFYAVLNSTGAVYRIDNPQALAANASATPTASYVNTPSPAVTALNTDGARCASARIVSLPVTLTAFTATALASRRVQLDWTTANEQNNDFFEVQHSVDGQQFAAIGQVPGHQTTTHASAYSFVHPTPGAGATHYYRLRQVDLDGTSTYGPVRAVTLAAPAAPWQLAVAPNPTTADALRVQVQAETTAPTAAVLEVRASLGQCVLRQAVALQPGSNELNINTNLAPGLYWLSLSSDAAPATQGTKVLITW